MQAHRGPDDEGVSLLQTAAGLTLGLAHRRLSILDLSPAGHQPMVDDATGNTIVFNGEIYNYREIAASLQARGERLNGTSDTEVLLKGYRHFGAEELLQRLRGMFAFALWDATAQNLLVARDPCGIKPLYYTVANGRFACASEAKALVRAGVCQDAVDPRAIDSFLAFGSVQAPLCIYRDVRVLLPGHLLWVKGDGTVERPRRYWDWYVSDTRGGVEAIRHWLQESTRRHLVADVPVGVFLSAGFDSTAMTALASRLAETPIETFTVGFPEIPQMSEADAAASIAARLGVEHHRLELRKSDLRRMLPVFFASMDQPSDDGLNVFLISSRVAQAGFKACLHGVGGDELFGGYPSFKQVPQALKLSVIPRWLRTALAAVIEGNTVARAKLANLLRGELSLLQVFLIRRSVFSFEQRQQLLGGQPPLGRAGVPDEWISYVRARIEAAPDVFSVISTLELAQYAGNKLLVDGDVMSMAHGLELRFPLLDVDLIRSALATPLAEKISNARNSGKPALTKAVEDFPMDLMTSGKRGFTLPLQRWLRSGLRAECRSLTTDLVQNFGMERNALEAVWHRLDRAGRGQEWLRAWQLYALGNWRRHHADVRRDASAA